MLRGGLVDIRRMALTLAIATVMLAGTCVALSSTSAAAATSASRTLAVATNGQWPGVGKICEPGPGGSSSVRGVGSKTINIAVFNDASNTVIPGLESEFPQQANAFAAWCRTRRVASTGATSSSTTATPHCSTRHRSPSSPARATSWRSGAAWRWTSRRCLFANSAGWVRSAGISSPMPPMLRACRSTRPASAPPR